MKRRTHIIKAIFPIGACALLQLWIPVIAYSAMSDYCSTPPYVSNNVPPNVLFVLDNSGSMNCSAYAGTYNPARFTDGDYFGLFDPTKMYRYDGNSWAVTTEVGSSSTPEDNPIASGNLLNWATMRRFDVAKRLLNGGRANPRSPNAGFTVKLEGEVPNSNAYCSEDLTVGTFDNSGIIPQSHLPSPYANVIYPFLGNYIYKVGRSGLTLTPTGSGGDFYEIPNANIRTTNWTVEGETDFWRAVDDPRGDSDGSTTYVRTSTVRSPVLFDYRHIGGTPGTIEGVTVVVVARRPDDSDRLRIQGVVQVNGANYANSSDVRVDDDGYDRYYFEWKLNPATGLAWNWSEIKQNGTESLGAFGVQLESNTDSDNHVRVTQVYLHISSNMPNGGPYRVVIDTGKIVADSGIIGALSNDARFGLATYNTDAEGGRVTDSIDFDVPTQMLVSIDNLKATTATPLGETLYTMVRYYRQNSTPYHSTDYNVGVNYDPYYYKYSSLLGGLTDRYVSCAKSFVLLMTDGEPTDDSNHTNWPTATQDSDNNGSRLDNVALWARTTDARPGTCSESTAQGTWVRPCVPRNQYVYTYTVFMFGRGSNLLKRTSVNGGFEGDSLTPPCYATGTGHPTQAELKRCYRPGPLNTTGTIDPSVDPPLTYYEGDDGYELREGIINAIAAIMKRAASGTAVSVLTTSSRGVGSLLQAYFLPIKQEGMRDVTWTGYTQNIWLDPADSLREDTFQDAALNLEEDRVIKLYYDESNTKTMAAMFNTDVDGNSSATTTGDLASCRTTDKIEFGSLSSLWEGGKKLALTRPGVDHRSIFTSKKIVVGNTSTTLDSTTTAKQPAFTTSMSATLKAALNGDATYSANDIIGYVRGECLETGASADDACGDTPNGTYRDRRIFVTGGDTYGNVWKLGDVINSTPKVFSGTYLNTYHLVYRDATYISYISTDAYKKRTSAISTIGFLGANDGMLHAFRIGYLKDKTDAQGTLSASIKAIFKNVFTAADSERDQIGKEVWAYIPYNAFPYLKYLADPAYCHIYYNDLSVNLLDASTGGTGNPNPTDVKTAASWKSILIGGMKFGGACSGGISPSGPPTGTPTDVGFSSFYALDITDPMNPVPLWEFTDPDMGYATSYPAVLRTGAEGDKNGYWYVVIGSGSKQLPKTAIDINRTTPGYIYILDLKTGSLVKKITLDHNAIVGDILAVDANRDNHAEKIYFGTAYKSTTWKGKLVSIDIPNQDLSTSWTASITNLFSDNYPFTASPDAVLDDNRKTWVYIGSGKYNSTVDQTDTSQQIFLGLKDVSSLTYPLSITPSTGLDDRTSAETRGTVTSTMQVCMFDPTSDPPDFGFKTVVNSIAPTTTKPNPSTAGWYKRLATSERVISRPLVIGGLVDYLTYIPNSDVCAAGGDSYLYSLDYIRGVAPENVPIGSPDSTTVVDVGTGGGTVGSKGGNIGNIVRVESGVKLGPGAPPTGEAIIVPPPKEGDSTGKLDLKIQVSTGEIKETKNETIFLPTSNVIQWLKK